MDKKTSLKDIAKYVGVSAALVSYVLNNKTEEARVNKRTAQKILKAATKLDYQPNLIAKGLKMGKTKMLGLIVADISNPFFSNMARIIEDQAKQNGYIVIFGSSDEDAGKSKDLLNALINRGVDGLIIAAVEHTEVQIKSLLKKKVPIVLVDRYFPKIKLTSIITNNFKASYDAVTHLIKNNYRKIGVVGYKNNLEHIIQRKNGYSQALKDAGLTPRKEWIVEVQYEQYEQDIQKSLGKLLSPKPTIDALFFCNNSLAVQGLKLIHKMNIKVPEKLGVVCFDESEVFDLFYAPVTCVKQDIDTIGRSAVTLILDQVNNKDHLFRQIEVNASLIIRESSGGMPDA